MSKKSAKISALIESCEGKSLPAHYLGFFECFNREEFFEAHDVLEELWLAQRTGPNYAFYKGLIQLAGAFVHLQKHSAQRPRLKPSAALFKLARTNLEKYPSTHENLNLNVVFQVIETWLAALEENKFLVNPLDKIPAPKLNVQF